jgi:hypothetical protein
MALIKIIWLFIKRLFTRKPKPTRTEITRDEILAYARNTPHIRNSVKKTKQRHIEKLTAEANAKAKKKKRNKAAKKSRKKNR